MDAVLLVQSGSDPHTGMVKCGRGWVTKERGQQIRRKRRAWAERARAAKKAKEEQAWLELLEREERERAEAKIRARLAQVDEGRRLLAEANSIPQVKEIQDRAEADWLYLRRQDASFSSRQRAAELKLKAERKLGKLLAVERGGGKRSRKTTVLPNGISRLQSERWQREAQVDDKEFEDFVIASKEKGVELSTGALLRFQREAERERERKREQENAAQSGPSMNGNPLAITAPPVPAILPAPPVPKQPTLCAHCRQYGYALCQACVLASDPEVKLENGILWRTLHP